MSLTQFVESPGIEWYSEKLKEHFIFEKREDGVLVARMHTKGGPFKWSLELHRAIGQMWRWVGGDDTVETVIFTGTGNDWCNDFDRESFLIEEEKPEFVRYEYMYLDGRRMLSNMIFGVEVPTIGVLNGSGGHAEMAMMCDITIMADNAFVSDPHFFRGMPPGDGVEAMFFELLNVKQGAYAMLMNEPLSAQKCLELGLVNEIVPVDRLLPRAYEIADKLMAQQRQVRRLTTQIMRRPWKKRLVDSLDGDFGIEMFSDFCRGFSHANINAAADWGRSDKLVHDEERYKKVEEWAKSHERK